MSMAINAVAVAISPIIKVEEVEFVRFFPVLFFKVDAAFAFVVKSACFVQVFYFFFEGKKFVPINRTALIIFDDFGITAAFCTILAAQLYRVDVEIYTVFNFCATSVFQCPNSPLWIFMSLALSYNSQRIIPSSFALFIP